jgi:hypothetical protein
LRERIAHLESQLRILVEHHVQVSARVSDLEMLLAEITRQSPEARKLVAEATVKRDISKIELATSILEHQYTLLHELDAPDVVRDPRNAKWAWLYLLAMTTKSKPYFEHLADLREQWETMQRKMIFQASVDCASDLGVDNGLNIVFYREAEEPTRTDADNPFASDE